MDPVSFLVTCFALYGLLTRMPGLIGEAMAEREYAARGEESPAAEVRRKKLEAAGFLPAATGGPMRRWAGNVWRDYWTDRAAQRNAEQEQQANDQAVSRWGRLQDRIDDAMRARTDRWRNPDHDQPPVTEPADPDDAAGATTTDPDDTGPTGGWVHDSEGPGRRPPRQATTEQRRPPIRVQATVGDPIPDPTTNPTAPPAPAVTGTITLAIERNPMSNGLAPQQVTGVVSGAAEARAIAREVNAAAEEFAGRIARARARIYALGEQSVGTVQLAMHSRVVAQTTSAAESAASAQAVAKSCATEVTSVLTAVARSFDQINS